MRTATKEDFKVGATLLDEENNEFKILSQYDEGVYEVRVFSGSRVVGEKVVYDSEARFYKVA